jgi:hypothetical protein
MRATAHSGRFGFPFGAVCVGGVVVVGAVGVLVGAVPVATAPASFLGGTAPVLGGGIFVVFERGGSEPPVSVGAVVSDTVAVVVAPVVVVVAPVVVVPVPPLVRLSPFDFT